RAITTNAHPPANTLGLPWAAVEPQLIASPTRMSGRPLQYTVPVPPVAVPGWHDGSGLQCTAHESPCRCAGMPLTNTSPLPLVLGRGGQEPCPEHISPSLVTAGISSDRFAAPRA